MQIGKIISTWSKFPIKLVFGAFYFVRYNKTVIDWLIGG